MACFTLYATSCIQVQFLSHRIIQLHMRHRKMNECHSEIFLTEILLHSSTDSAVQAKKRNTPTSETPLCESFRNGARHTPYQIRRLACVSDWRSLRVKHQRLPAIRLKGKDVRSRVPYVVSPFHPIPYSIRAPMPPCDYPLIYFT